MPVAPFHTRIVEGFVFLSILRASSVQYLVFRTGPNTGTLTRALFSISHHIVFTFAFNAHNLFIASSP
jgi:hypothetical protein